MFHRFHPEKRMKILHPSKLPVSLGPVAGMINLLIIFIFAVLQKAFNSFDSQKSGSISTELVADILRLMGQPFDKKILEELIEEVDEDSKFELLREFGRIVAMQTSWRFQFV